MLFLIFKELGKKLLQPKRKPNKKYTPDFKIMVVERMEKEGMSHKEAKREYGLPHGRAAAWERIHLEEGA